MSKVSQETLVPEPDTRAPDHAIELSLAAAECHVGLGRGPRLDRMATEEYAPTAGALPGPGAPSPVGVRVHLDGAGGLPSVHVHHSR